VAQGRGGQRERGREGGKEGAAGDKNDSRALGLTLKVVASGPQAGTGGPARSLLEWLGLLQETVQRRNREDITG
jgi:hypothetical protein